MACFCEYTNLNPSPGDSINVLLAKIAQRLGLTAMASDGTVPLLSIILSGLNGASPGGGGGGLTLAEAQALFLTLAQGDARYVLKTGDLMTGSLTINPLVNTSALIASNSLTGANAQSILSLAPTWNTTGTPSAILLNVTNTASNADSNTIRLQVNSNDTFRQDVSGRTYLTRQVADTAPIILELRKRGTTGDVNGAVALGANYGRWDFRGWTGTQFLPGALIQATASATFTDTNTGTNLNFGVAAPGSATVTTRAILNSTGWGIGVAPSSLLHVATDTTALGLTIFEQASADTDGYDLSFRKARGTVAVPTAITTGDVLGTLMFRGYSGAAGYVTSATILAVASGTIASTRVGSSLVFATGTDAAPTVLTDRMTINNLGDVSIGTTSTIPIRLVVVGANAGGTLSAFDTSAGKGATINPNLTAGSVAFYSDFLGGAEPKLHISNYSSRSGAGGITINTSGLVGVFTTTPLEELSVINNFGVYETLTDSSNYTRIKITAVGANHLIRTEAAGTGTLRILQVGTGPSTGTDIAGVSTIIHGGQATGSGAAGAILFQQSLPVGGSGAAVTALATTWRFNTAGHLLPNVDTTYDIGAAAGSNVKGVFANTLNAASSAITAVRLGAGTTAGVAWNGAGSITWPSDGVMQLRNDSSTNFNRLQFGGTTNSFNAIGRDAVNGFTLQSAAATATWNDASTAASGTVANRYLFGLAAPTLSSTNATVTYTVASSIYLGGAPVAGTNVTIGTSYALAIAAGNIGLLSANNIVLDTVTGTKIGTATAQKLAFYNATPIVQGASVADASGGAVIDAEARTAINALISRIEATGLIATV